MIYRREEPFRFQFQKPLEGTFKILRVNGIAGESKEGSALILDLSPNGLKFKSSLDLPTDKHQLLLEVSFSLNETQILIMGEPTWKKKEGNAYVYGFIGLDDQQTKTQIILALKEYSKKIYNKFKNQN